jgi:hypothetical protein
LTCLFLLPLEKRLPTAVLMAFRDLLLSI